MTHREKVKSVIYEVIGEDEFTEDDFLKDVYHYDSILDTLDFIEIIMKVEHDYHISIPDEDCEKFNTVDDFVKYLEKLIPQTP